MDLWVREARLFKYGSGTGTNFSALRGDGERLSGGGRSSGLMSFLKIGDRAAGAIKSGGTTRRAAKMVIVDIDHPDIEEFIDWKVVEEQKVAALVAGSKLLKRACRRRSWPPATSRASRVPRASTRRRTRRCARRSARRARRCCRRAPSSRSSSMPARATTSIEIPVYDTDWDSDAYLTVAGQNSNNTVRVSDEFMRAVAEDRDWQLFRRTDGKVAKTTLKARQLWDRDRFRRLGQRRSRRAVRHDHQRLAYLPERGAHQRVQSVLGVHVPRRHGLQPRLPQPHGVPERGRQLRGRRVCPCRPPVDDRSRDLGADGAVPGQEDRRALLAVPDPRPGLRQSGRPADGLGPRLRQRGRPRVWRRHHRADDRHLLQGLGRDGRGAGPVPGLCREPRGGSARASQSSPGRLERGDRL